MTLQRTSKSDRLQAQVRELQRLNQVYKRERDEALAENIDLKRDLLKMQQQHIAHGVECYHLGWRDGKRDASEYVREMWRSMVDTPRRIPDEIARAVTP